MSKPLRVCSVCGLEAWTETDLEKFVKGSKYPYGRQTLCKKCYSTRRKIKAKRKIDIPSDVTDPLRICRVCGFKAFNKDDLEKFAKSSRDKYGRRNICKSCKKIVMRKYYGRYMHTNEKRQLRLIKNFQKPLICYFCGENILKLKGCDSDSLVFHSLDGNHDNWNPENKVPAHFACHESYHHKGKTGSKHHLFGRKLSIEHRINISKSLLGEKNKTWKGDEAKERSKKARYWRRKRIEKRWEELRNNESSQS